MTDAAGDNTIQPTGGLRIHDVGGQFGRADLRGLTAVEVTDGIWVNVTTGPGSASDSAFYVRILVNATFDGLPYQLYFDQRQQDFVAYWSDQGTYHIVDTLPVVMSGDTRSALVPRGSLLDANGAAGLIGKVLVFQDVSIVNSAFAYTPEGPFLQLDDEMTGPVTLTLALGDASSRDVRLRSPEPMRNSNGAETVYNYAVNVESLLDSTQTITLTAAEVRSGWAVHFPINTIQLDPHKVQNIPVLLSVPFAHHHGKEMTFVVQARHLDADDLLSQVRLGVRYTTVPQPAGHHDTVWLHSRMVETPTGAKAEGYFNAQIDDEQGTRAPVPATDCRSDGLTGRSYIWQMRLDPSLQIGLSFDTTRAFELELPIQPQVPMTGILRASITVNGVAVASTQTQDQVELPANQVTMLHAIMALDPQLNSMPYLPGGYMQLAFNFTEALPSRQPALCLATGPSVMPGGVMTMPLFEYRDPLPRLSSGALNAEKSPERVAPGSSLVIEHRLTAPAEHAIRAQLRMFGPGSEHATLSTTEQRLAARSFGDFTLHVNVPTDATSGGVFDIVVEATDGEFIAMHRTSFVVDPTAERVTETNMPPTARQAGAPGSIVGLLLILAFASRSRNR